jgi:hypothetical protein
MLAELIVARRLMQRPVVLLEHRDVDSKRAQR